MPALFVAQVAYTLFDDLGCFVRKEKRDVRVQTPVMPSIEIVMPQTAAQESRPEPPYKTYV
jgi:hypothetical protein